jgi:hypothetical protein
MTVRRSSDFASGPDEPRPNMKTPFQLHLRLWPLAFAIAGSMALAATTNVPPTPVVLSAVQRPGTTFMDIDYRVDDPDDATVQTAALGFVNGGTNLADVIKISTLVEGTAANIGSNTPANTQRRLTWNVAADWNTNFGNVQVEILAKDGRGLLPFHWITLPSNGPNPEITINDRPIYDADLLPIWYWLIATGDPAMQLVNGQVLGVSSDYGSTVMARGTTTSDRGRDFLYGRFDLRSLTGGEIQRVQARRYGFQSVDAFSIARGFAEGPDRIYCWGNNDAGQLNSVSVANLTAVALGYQHTLFLAGGGVTGWGRNSEGQTTIPATATNLIAIAAGYYHSLALREDGTVIAWGYNSRGQSTVPSGLSRVQTISAGSWHSLALTSSGQVVGWGSDDQGQITTPAGLTNAVAIAAGGHHSLALSQNRLVTAWGYNNSGEAGVPSGLSNVVAIAAGHAHSLALKADGTLASWGAMNQSTVPTGLSNVVAIAAGYNHNLGLKADGTIVVWGSNGYGQLNVPSGLSVAGLIGVGCEANHIVVVDKRTP